MRTLYVTLLVLSICSAAQADYHVKWSSINAGGGTTSGSGLRVSMTLGQPAAGFTKSTGLLHWIGFWAGDVPTPTLVPTLTAAKVLPDGTFISVAGKVATSGVGDFPLFFYAEDPAACSGIRIAVPPSVVEGISRGSAVNVIGTLSTTPEGERQIAGPMVLVLYAATPPPPLGMPNRSLGGSDLGMPPLGQYGVTGGAGLNNVGLLVKTWGKVVSAGTGYVDIDDGSGPVRVDTSLLASQPVQESYIAVIGISSIYKPGEDRMRLVLPRGTADILAY